MLEFGVFYDARQVFDEMLKRAFIHVFGHSTYAQM